ncbi:type VI secretion system-associated protein TagO [Niveispirillum sp. KHB5.9]|uniref:type VI secretion system-associated protein TagO n=1 Tax=Niveispirillum sp. KHB5.9 TaxID=3400269 RepID=UPI003A8B0B04
MSKAVPFATFVASVDFSIKSEHIIKNAILVWNWPMRRTLCFLAVMSTAFSSAQATPQEDLKRSVAKCAGVADSVLRAQCYDELARSIGVDTPKTSASSNGKWNLREKSSPIDDSKTVVGMLEADETVSVGSYQRTKPTFVVRCSENVTSVYFVYDVFLGSDETETTTRVDSDKAVTEIWSISTDHKAVGMWEGTSSIPFLKRLAGKNRLIVRLTPYSESPVTVSFSLDGLANVATSVARTCGWKM